MRVLSLPALLVACAVATPAAAQTPIIPGYWESTNRLLSPFRTSKVERRCLTPADVDKFLAGPSNRHYDCSYPTRIVENGQIRMAGTCVGRKGGRAVQVTGEGSYTPTSFQITATIATEFAGIPLRGRGSTEAHRLGDVCPEPAEGQGAK